MSKDMSILVVGAGIIGLRTAAKLRHAGYSVVLYSKDFPKDSTSNGAGGYWMPYQCEPAHLVERWAERTLKYFFELHEKDDSVVENIKCVKAFNSKDNPPPLPVWAEWMDGRLNVEVVETSAYGLSLPEADKFYSWDGFVIDCPRYLERTLQQLSADKEVRLELGRAGFTSLSEVVDYAKRANCVAVMNCVGRGASEVCNDELVVPARGALVHYNRPSTVKMVVTTEVPPFASAELPAYVIPRGDVVVCGGTYLEGDLNDQVSVEESERIRKSAEALCPDLVGVKPTKTWVGFRPARATGIRFETERVDGVPIFHNYGHGGSGWTIFEGSTQDTVDTLQRELAAQSKY